MKRPVFFCHIPKTGGTSLRVGLENGVSPQAIVPAVKEISALGRYPTIDVALEAIRVRSPKLVRGHYHFSFHLVMDWPVTVVMLREPIARTISHIKRNIRAKQLTPEQAIKMLDAGKLPVIDNQMTRMLAGLLDLRPERIFEHHKQLLYGPIKDEHRAIASARYAIHTVDVLGITERFDDFARRLENVTGIVLPKEKRNVSRIEGLKLTEEHIETIREHNKLDRYVYDYALKEIG